MLLLSTFPQGKHPPNNSSYCVVGPVASLRRTASTASLRNSPRLVSESYLTDFSVLRFQGFTLMEVVIVMALFSLLLSLGLILSLDVYRGTTFRSTRSVLVSSLTTARGRAMNNVLASPHGVCYSAPDFILFRGPLYSPSAVLDRIPGNPVVRISSPSDFFTCGIGTGVIFAQLDGTTTQTATLTITEDGRPSSQVSVTSEGTIIW